VYYDNTNHVTKDCPNLLEKWEVKKEDDNTVTLDPCVNQKPEEEVDVWEVN
jgi:hypothetical protein